MYREKNTVHWISAKEYQCWQCGNIYPRRNSNGMVMAPPNPCPECEKLLLSSKTHSWRRANNPTYTAWMGLKQRNVIDPIWENDFDAFLLEVGPKPPNTYLHHIDKSKMAGPGNVVWKLTKSAMTLKNHAEHVDHRVEKVSRLLFMSVVWRGKRPRNLYKCKDCGVEVTLPPSRWWKQTWFPCQHTMSVCPKQYYKDPLTGKRMQIPKADPYGDDPHTRAMRDKAARTFAAMKNRDYYQEFADLGHFIKTIGLPQGRSDRLCRNDTNIPNSPSNTYWSSPESERIQEAARKFKERGPVYKDRKEFAESVIQKMNAPVPPEEVVGDKEEEFLNEMRAMFDDLPDDGTLED